MSSSGCIFFFILFLKFNQSSCQGLRLIFTGDSSVLTGHRAASKPSKAEKYSMQEITPESVAYIATQISFSPHSALANLLFFPFSPSQIYFSLCCFDSWGMKDGYFNLEHFYNVFLRLFTANPGDEWVKETLAYLTWSILILLSYT